ncbi:DUF1707 domain-containing protein [Actinomadura logoneensis]|uniref:DUF1707 domain-containing protein n=1 Tax=Actinomadura logoneensis TaxID=2293572 RepID=A0A372JCZ3_9ACTN|nr:DUF1707 domain-containing protein [Actinomadura logoneensis]
MNPGDALRVGDAERDAVALALHEHFAAGRLDRAELDDRLGAALAARTLGDLRAVVRDLPEPNGLPAPAWEPVPPRHAPRAFGRGRHGHHWHGDHGHGHRGSARHASAHSHEHANEHELTSAWGHPAAWPHAGHAAMGAGAGHPAWRGHHRRRALFPMLAVLFAVVALGSSVGTAFLTVFHVVAILWIVRALALLVRTRRRRRALR